jgi:Prp8 binding protein
MIRKSPPPGAQGTLIKRARPASPTNEQQIIVSSTGNDKEQGLIRTVKRTSGLDVSLLNRFSKCLANETGEQAPIVSLAGAHGVSIDLLLADATHRD